MEFWNRNAPHTDRINRRYKHNYASPISVRSNDAMRLTFPIRDMYLNGIDAADHDIRLTSAYFIPDHVLLDSLKRAAARGVDVQVLVPWTSNHIVADWASHAYFTECLRGGIRIFGFQHAMIEYARDVLGSDRSRRGDVSKFIEARERSRPGDRHRIGAPGNRPERAHYC